LCHRTTFFVENTLAFDDNTIYVDRETQTVESGNVCCDTSSQTIDFYHFTNVFTDNILSQTMVAFKKHQLDCEHTQYDEDDENVENEYLSDSYCQTIFIGSH
jgi:hypothetical protein